MIIEKMVIYVFVMLVPLLLYILRSNGGLKQQQSLVMFVFMSGAAYFCLQTSFHDVFSFLAVSYLPIFLAFFYGGKWAGWGVGTVAGVCILISGVNVVLAITQIVLVCLLCTFVLSRFEKLHAKWVRVRFAFWSSLAALVLQIGAMITWRMSGMLLEGVQSEWYDELLLTLAISFVMILLYESMREREQMVTHMLDVERYLILGELAASIAHELRNPLTVVRGCVDLLDEKRKRSEYHQLIVNELTRAEGIIEDYVSLARSVSSFKMEQKGEVLVRESVRGVVSLFEAYARRTGIKLAAQCEEGLYVHAIDVKLKYALTSVIKNAFDSTESGGSITIKTYLKDENKVVYEIKDTGVGMTTDQLEKIGTTSFTTKASGTGFGTVITAKFIHEMGGTITYDSRYLEGTTVHMTLPLAKKVEEQKEKLA